MPGNYLPMEDALDRLHAFVHYHNRRFLLQNGEFGVNGSGAQCVNVSNEWAHKLHLPGFEGNAADFLAQSPAGWRRVANTPEGVPARGSVVVFHGPETGEAGHTSVFLYGNKSSFESFDQNWPEGAACRRIQHDYGSVVGWFEPDASLRPHGGCAAQLGETSTVWTASRGEVSRILAAWVKTSSEDRLGGR